MTTKQEERSGVAATPETTRGIQVAGQQLQQLKREVSLARRILQGEPEDSATGSLAHDLERWDGVMDEIRNAMVALTAEHDRLQIAHDKLRERLDVHSLRPRGVVAAKAPPKAAATSGPHVLSSGQSQDFTAIDAELSKLNESMMRAMSE